MSTDKDWQITYKVNGTREESVVKPWPSRPSPEDAAQLLRDHIFGDEWLIPDTPLDIRDITVWQMKQKGYEITSINEWKL